MPDGSVSTPGAGSVGVGGNVRGNVTTYVGALQGTPLRVATQNFARVFELVDVANVVGRGWLFEQFSAFKRSHDRGYFVVEAEAGLGKSTFAAWLVAKERYLGHFTRLPGGSERRNALLNLSAQLIESQDLFPEIEGKFDLPGINRKIVPEWAGEPAHFAKLLELAAEKAQQRGRGITLVVDGLDEESPPSTPVPLGLPAVLPPCVHLVTTCRSGTSLSTGDTAKTVAHISADDPRNLADMREFLAIATAKPPLADRLSRAGVRGDEFVARVIGQCGGVWVYMAHLLADIGSGELGVADLARVPVKLSQYFADNFARRRADARWASEDLPLLGTLGAVREPVSATLLSDVTGVAAGRVRDLCTQRYRAFLRRGSPHSSKAFELYHGSLAEFFTGKTTDGPGFSEATMDLADELAERVAEAHRRIADHYLTELGKPGSTRNLLTHHGGYGARHLVSHLRHAGRHEELRRLLTAAIPPGGSWYALQTGRDGTDTYVQDLETELGPAREDTDEHDPLRGDLESLRFEVFATLFLAERTTSPADVPLELIDPLLRWRLWNTDVAREHLATVSNPALYATGLVALLPHANRADLEPEMETALARIVQPVDRLTLQARLLEFRTPPDAARRCEQLLPLAGNVTDPLDRAKVLLSLLPYAADGRRDRHLETALEILGAESGATRAHGLAAAISFVPASDVEPLVDEALALAATTGLPEELLSMPAHTRPDHRTAVAAAMLDHLPAPTRTRVWQAAQNFEVPLGYEGVAHTLTFARHAPGAEIRQRLTRRALRIARGITDVRIAARALAEIHRSLAS